MRKMTLRLDSRLVLRDALAVVKPSDNWVIALRKFDVLRATELTEEEEKAVENASAITIICDNCKEKTTIQSGRTRLGELPESPKEVLLEDEPFKWLVKFKEEHLPWPANEAFYELNEAIEGAEKVKPGKGKK